MAPRSPLPPVWQDFLWLLVTALVLIIPLALADLLLGGL